MLIAKLLCVTLIMITKCCECANILYVIPFTSKSHYILLSPIGLELARRGHNVTVITANREHNPPSNYHQIMVDDVKIWEVIGEERPNIFTMVNLPAEIFHQKILWGGGAAFTEVALNSSDVQHLLKSDSKFDLVICEQFFQEAFYVLAQKYNAPLALVTTFGNCMRHNILTRNPLQLATVVSEFLDVEDPTSFWSRLRNVYFAVYEFVWWKYWYLEKQETLVKKYIPDVKDFSLYDIQKNFSVMLINSHFSYDVPAAYLPNIIEIGGIHLTQSYGSPPKDLQKLLDGSEAGIIYVNFGSNVRSAEMPLEKRDAFLNVFRTLKQMVLWKWENESIVNKPDNLITQPWFPQREILAHKNVKLFISHGGLIGTQEAIYNGIPIIGVPIYADQLNNLLLVEQHGFGKVLRYNDINEHNLKTVVNEVLNNDCYKKNAEIVSARFKDRPMTPLETAIFWLEYTIRHRGSDFIKNPAINLSWFAFTMIDVYFYIALLVIISITVAILIIDLIRTTINSNRIIKYKYN
ncbi:UDP-glycosyltransferase UGT5-like [Leptidea sinapis]|uniref:UDP-glycosyltransferase UGT5-like n=1 Tax=Leptidea sinapis TaxID=189913 RepID=UPI00212E3FC5|nr:UDP-glycosyltransferase UGT5-like [Leptidea sinapis]XP_050682128.1 UDP-glycosyltransferase UGT5-like [Leptidea sinapis]XP_050682129.1 UDP-glycosyltransferase UGT5-like [Leptidea sinapis]